jgi:hypothetical protein
MRGDSVSWCKRELCRRAIASVQGSEVAADDDDDAAANACRAIEILQSRPLTTYKH